MLERFLRESDTIGLKHTTTAAAPINNTGALGNSDTIFSSFVGFSGAPGSHSPTAIPAHIGRFQSASINKLVAIKKKERRLEGGYLAKDPATTVDDLNIEPYIDDWAEKVRWWISEKVVKPLVKRIVRVSILYFSLST
jgi:hypothetical protein